MKGHLLQVLSIVVTIVFTPVCSDTKQIAEVFVDGEFSQMNSNINKNSNISGLPSNLVLQHLMDVFTYVKINYNPTLSINAYSRPRYSCEDEVILDCVCCPEKRKTHTTPATASTTPPPTTTTPTTPSPTTTHPTTPSLTTTQPTTPSPTTTQPTTPSPTTTQPKTPSPTTQPTTPSSTTTQPTTPSPTTTQPTTPSPTTQPTTPPPTTTKPTTPSPTTQPTTPPPTTTKPTTPSPTTQPTTPSPTTTQPTTPSPTTTQPTTPPPTTTKPTTKPQKKVKCPRTYFNLGDECFRAYCDMEMQWGKAQWMCDGDDSYLAEPKNTTALAQYIYAHHPHKHYWLGARGTGSYIQWVHGDFVAKTEPWAQYQPEGRTDDFCLDLRIDWYSIDRPLAAHRCRMALNHYFICETNARIW